MNDQTYKKINNNNNLNLGVNDASSSYRAAAGLSMTVFGHHHRTLSYY
jgi:hypothetical protein